VNGCTVPTFHHYFAGLKLVEIVCAVGPECEEIGDVEVSGDEIARGTDAADIDGCVRDGDALNLGDGIIAGDRDRFTERLAERDAVFGFRKGKI